MVSSRHSRSIVVSENDGAEFEAGGRYVNNYGRDSS